MGVGFVKNMVLDFDFGNGREFSYFSKGGFFQKLGQHVCRFLTKYLHVETNKALKIWAQILRILRALRAYVRVAPMSCVVLRQLYI